MREGVIVDAMLIAVPPSAKNKDAKRDSEMHQLKKGNDRHFGMRARVGVGMAAGWGHSVHGDSEQFV